MSGPVPIESVFYGGASSQSISDSYSSNLEKFPKSVKSPLFKSTVGLLPTYQAVYQHFYRDQNIVSPPKPPRQHQQLIQSSSSSSSSQTNSFDDEEGNLVVCRGDIIQNRYELLGQLGKGSFGIVWKVYDQISGNYFALKIIKSMPVFQIQAEEEIKILTFLNAKDDTDNYSIVRMITSFLFRNHYCILFELLSKSLYEVLRQIKFKGFQLPFIKQIAFQLLTCQQFISRSDVKVIHCDLKPENILLCQTRGSKIKVIDFGSSCQGNKRKQTYIQSRFYRSPEVLLELPYSCGIDCWSIGCILAELLTGKALFDGVDAFDQMYRISLVCGIPPDYLLKESKKSSVYFEFDNTSQQYLHLKPKNNSSKNLVSRTLREILHVDGPASWYKEKCCTQNDLVQFLDLVSALLIIDPLKRITAENALNLPFFQMPCSSSEIDSQNQNINQNLNSIIKESPVDTENQNEKSRKNQSPRVIFSPQQTTTTTSSSSVSTTTTASHRYHLRSQCVVKSISPISGFSSSSTSANTTTTVTTRRSSHTQDSLTLKHRMSTRRNSIATSDKQSLGLNESFQGIYTRSRHRCLGEAIQKTPIKPIITRSVLTKSLLNHKHENPSHHHHHHHHSTSTQEPIPKRKKT